MNGQPPSPPAFKKQVKHPFGMFELPKLPKEAFFNPTIARSNGTLWMFCRRNINRGEGHKLEYNDIVAFPIDRTGNVIGERKEIRLPQGFGLRGREHFEDPRAMTLGSGNVLLTVCTFIPYNPRTRVGSWAHQAAFVLGPSLECIGRTEDPVHGRNYSQATVNDGHEKNWTWFFTGGGVHCVYRHDPMEVVRWSDTMDRKTHVFNGSKKTKWAWGEIRGGTNPVKVGNLWWTFFHSSTDWRLLDGKRCYHMGALAFEETGGGGFELARISKKPILSGTYHGFPYDPRFPICVFPGGAEYMDGEWFIVYGINDIECGWIRIPHASLEETTTIHLDHQPSPQDNRLLQPRTKGKRAWVRPSRRANAGVKRVLRQRKADGGTSQEPAQPGVAVLPEHPAEPATSSQ